MAIRYTHNNILTEYSGRVLLTDFFLRWASLGVFRLIFQPSQAERYFGTFIFIQVLVTLFTLFYALFRDFRFRQHIENIDFDYKDWTPIISYFSKGFNLEKPYDIISSTFSLLLRIFFVFSFCYMMASVLVNLDELDLAANSIRQQTMARNVSITVAVTLMFYGSFILYVSTMCVPKTPEEDSLVSIFKKAQEIREAEKTAREKDIADGKIVLDKDDISDTDMMVDLNDIAIVQLEGDAKNYVNRVEAYILESVMFGALTFSGFLTLIAIDPDTLNISNIRTFGAGLMEFLHDFALFEFQEINSYQIFANFPDANLADAQEATQVTIKEATESVLETVKTKDPNMKESMLFLIENATEAVRIAEQTSQKTTQATTNLVFWIMIETLVSSTFFLLVIASRLRFTKIIEKIDNAIRLAQTYNHKEEEVFMLHLQFDQSLKLRRRLEILSKKIEEQIRISNQLLKEAKPIVGYMSFFRNLGVLMFLIIIITSLLFFDFSLAVSAAFLAVAVYLYKEFDDWYRSRRLKTIMQHQQEKMIDKKF